MLRASGCGNLQEVLIQLPASLPLHDLYLDNCKSLRKLTVVAPKLRYLHIGGGKKLTEALRKLTVVAPNLRYLHIGGGKKLTEALRKLTVVAPNLRYLHIGGGKKLTEALRKLTVVAPNLRYLHIGGGKKLTEISLRCPSLENVVANLCFSLADIEQEQWQCPNIRSLNLYGASHLETASLALILNQARNLSSLDLNGCNTITSLQLDDHPHLSFCDVSACKGLAALRVACPRLKELYAKSCPRLTDVHVDSPVLEVLDACHSRHLHSVYCAALHQVQQQQEGGPLPATAVLIPDQTFPDLRIIGSDLGEQLLSHIRTLRSRRKAALRAASDRSSA
eukprot:gene29833-17938_t